MKELFDQALKVVNLGLPSFKEALDACRVEAVQVEFKPRVPVAPAARSAIRAHAEAIAKANETAVARLLAAKPTWVGMGRALDLVPGMKPNILLHAGPPVTWERMCGPMRGAVMGALVYEGLAKSPEAAEQLAASGEIEFAPCHEHQAVGPMAGLISASMPVFVIENREHGNRVYATQNEGLGKVLRYGAYSPDVVERLRWMAETLYPTLKAAIERLGSIDLKSVIAQALHMGDEVHNRNRAATSLFYRALAPAVIEVADKKTAAEVLGFVNGNDHFFLNLSMAACKASLDAARDVPGSSLVVTMARNGTDFGVQLSGTGSQWFVGPSPVPDALFFKGYTKEDANPDIGDSAITETGGLGGFAIAASPAIVQFVGGSVDDAVHTTLQMYEITLAENNAYQIPGLDFRGTPTGIDVVRVIETQILPFIDTGVAHRLPGVGQVGAGVLAAPLEPFLKAYEGLAKTL